MVYELTKEASVGGIGDIFYVSAPFDAAMKLFKKNGLQLSIGKDLAGARTLSDVKSSLCQNGSRIREGPLYIPKKYSSTDNARILLLRESLVIPNADRATNEHRKCDEFCVAKKYAELQEQAGEGYESSVFELKSTKSIPTNRFSDEALPIWLFGANAKVYGDFLKEHKINEMPLWFNDADYINNQSKPYANQLWLAWFGDNSALLGDSRSLNGNGRARGVRYKKNAEGGRAETQLLEHILEHRQDIF